MKKITLLMIVLLWWIYGNAQVVDSAVHVENPFERLEIEGGVTIGQGRFKEYVRVSPHIAVWYRIPWKKRFNLNLGGSLTFPKARTFHHPTKDYSVKMRGITGMIGGKLDYIVPLHHKKSIAVEFNTVAGLGFYGYEDLTLRREYEGLSDQLKKEIDKTDFNKALPTIHVGQGIKLSIRNFGLFARYNLSPHGLFDPNFHNQIGARSINIGLFYRQY